MGEKRIDEALKNGLSIVPLLQKYCSSETGYVEVLESTAIRFEALSQLRWGSDKSSMAKSTAMMA